MTTKLDFEDPFAAPAESSTSSNLDFKDPFAAPQPAAAPKAAAPKSGMIRRTLGDTAVDVGRGVIGVGEAAVGVADLATGGQAGKALESVGYRPEDTKEMIGELYSPERKLAQEKVAQAEGFVDTAATMLENPSTIAGAVAESVPSMLGGGAVARGLGAVSKLSPVARAAIGEGTVGAGQAAESLRQQSDDGLLSGRQTAAALGTGVGTGLVGAAGGAVARRLGIGDVDTALAGGATVAGEVPGVVRRTLAGAASEGVLEEMPQSMQEQAWQNFANEAPLGEGVPEAAAAGLLTGAAMGGPFAAVSRPPNAPDPELADAAPDTSIDTEQANELLALPAPGPITVDPQGTAATPTQAYNKERADAEFAQDRATRGLTPDVDRARSAHPGAAPEVLPDGSPLPNPSNGPLSRGVNIGVQSGAVQQAAAEQAAAQAAATAEEQAKQAKTIDGKAERVDPLPAPLPPRNMDPATGELIPFSEPEIRAYVNSVLDRGGQAKAAPIAKGFGLDPKAMRDIIVSVRDERKRSALAKPSEAPNAAATGRPGTGRTDDAPLDAVGAGRLSGEGVDGDDASAPARAAGQAAEPVDQAAATERASADGLTERKLPRELSRAKPRYSYGEKKFQLEFASDADRAAYIAAQPRPSKRDADYLRFAQEATGLDEAGVRARGAEIRASIKAMAKDAEPGRLALPAFDDGQASTGVPEVEGATASAANQSVEAPPPPRVARSDSDRSPSLEDAPAAAGSGISALPAAESETSDTRTPAQVDRARAFAEANDLAGESTSAAKAAMQALLDDPDAPRLSGILRDGVDSAGNKRPEWSAAGNGFEARQYVYNGNAVQEVRSPNGSIARRRMDADGITSADLEGTGTIDQILSGAPFREFGEFFQAKKAIAPAQSEVAVAAPPRGPVPTAGELRSLTQGASVPVNRKPWTKLSGSDRWSDGERIVTSEALAAMLDPRAGAIDGEATRVRSTPADVADAAAEAATSPTNNRPEPTEAQKEAGNYKKGHARVAGLDISIENPAGSRRRPEWPPLQNHYGYFKGSVGADKDHVDVFLTDRAHDESLPVFVVDQYNKGGRFDEHKVVMGAADEAEARAAYLRNYEPGWDGLGAITQMTQAEFKKWVRDPRDTKRPAFRAQVVSRGFTPARKAQETITGRRVAAANAAREVQQGAPDGAAARSGLPRIVRKKDAVAALRREAGLTVAAAEQAWAAIDRGVLKEGTRSRDSVLAAIEQAKAADTRLANATTTGAPTAESAIDRLRTNKAFRSALKKIGDPSVDSEVAAFAAQGWEDAMAKRPANDSHMADTGRLAGSQNPTDAYISAYLAASGAEPREVRARDAAQFYVEHGPDGNGGTTTDSAVSERTASSPPADNEAEAQPTIPAPPAPAVPANTIFTEDAAEAARAVLRAKLGQLNTGIDPEIMQAGITLAGYHIEKGARTFTAYSQAMLADLGEQIRPYLKSWYSAIKLDPRASGFEGMDTLAQLEAADVDTIAIASTESNQAPEGQAQEADNGNNPEPARGAADGQEGNAGADAAGVRADAGVGRTGDLLGAASAGDDRADGRTERPARRPAKRKPATRKGKGNRGDPQSSGRAGVGGHAVDGKPGSRNYNVQPGGLTREGSWMDAARRNVDAMALALQLEKEGRLATPEEQAQLAKYVGFGASEVANRLFPVHAGTRAAQYDPSRIAEPGWRAIAEKLKDTLTTDQLATVMKSTQYAHYTSETVTRGIWSAMERMGFKGGKVFEPGMGHGNFPMTAPAELAPKIAYTGLEMDHLTAAIGRQLVQGGMVLRADYTKQKLPNDSFDIAVGNPPFASTVITADPDYRKHRFMLHDYFFAKTIDKVRPGGLLAFVTSAGTMNKGSEKARQYIAERADLLGAIRLPDTAFLQNAGTEVVTDILFFRKRLPGEAPGGEAWMSLATVDAPRGDGTAGEALVNEYFVAHPEMVVGEHSLTGKMRGRPDAYNVRLPEGQTLEDLLPKAIARLPADVFAPAEAKRDRDQVIAAAENDLNPDNRKEGGLYVKGKEVMVTRNGAGRPLAATEKLTPKESAWLVDAIGLRDTLKVALDDQRKDGPWEASLKALEKSYKAFVKKHGPINDFTETERTVRFYVNDAGVEVSLKAGQEPPAGFEAAERTNVARRYKNKRLLAMDVESPLLMALETETDEGKMVASRQLTRRSISPPAEPRIESTADALVVSLNRKGYLDIDHVAELAKVTPEKAIADLGDRIYQSPLNDEWVMADAYLSGDVVTALEEAEAAARANPAFDRNVEALRRVQPEPLTPRDITVQLGMTWLEPDVINQFAAEVLGIGNAAVQYNADSGLWKMNAPRTRSAREAEGDFNHADRSAGELLDAVLNNREIKVTRTEKTESGTRTYTDTEATTAVNELAKKMRERFGRWVWEDADRAQEVASTYNTLRNRIIPRTFDGEFLDPPGLALMFKPDANGRGGLHPHQKRAVWRQVQTGTTYLNHAVGAGKTLEMIIGAMEQKRLGLISKPMFTVPNHMLGQFAAEFLEAYPAANVMVADEDSFTKEKRRQFVAAATVNAPDAIIITHSALRLLRVRPESMAAVVEDMVADLEAAIEDAGSDDRITRKKLEGQLERLRQRVDSKADAEGQDDVVFFEDMGVDMLYVDEAHEFRKLDFVTNRQNVKGIDPQGSAKALDLYAKIRYLHGQRPGRSHVLASGTAITNTMGELFTVQKFLDYDGLRAAGLHHFDAWASEYGEVVTEYERNAAGQYKPVDRFAKFNNLPELMMQVRERMDVLTSTQLGSLVKRPDVVGGQPQMAVTPASEALSEYMSTTLAPRIETSLRWKPSRDQPHNPDPMLAIIGDARLAVIDMRFVDPTAPSDPTSKLNLMIDRIIEQHAANADVEFEGLTGKGATQIVFSPIGFGAGVAKRRGFDARAWMMRRFREAGIPAEQVAWMTDLKTNKKRQAVFKEMRAGRVRILIGSPANMGTGVNVQNRLRDLHFLSPPWYPSDVEQPHGRILRQGNLNPLVSLTWYVTEGTYDSTGWGMVARKGRFIEQVMRADKTLRSAEDISEVSQYALASALASGDDRAVRVAELEANIGRLRNLQGDHENSVRHARSELSFARRAVEKNTSRLERAIEAKEVLGSDVIRADSFEFHIGGRPVVAEDRAQIGLAIARRMKQVIPGGPRITATGGSFEAEIGQINGKYPLVLSARPGAGSSVYIDIDVQVGPLHSPVVDSMKFEDIPAGDREALSFTTRMMNAVNRVASMPEEIRADLADAKKIVERNEKRAAAPWPQERELFEKVAELANLQQEMAKESEAPQQPSAPAEPSPQPAEDPQPTFSQPERPVSRGMTAEQLTRAIASVVSEWSGDAPRVEVLADAEGLPARAKRDPGYRTAEGYYEDGVVYLVAANLRSPTRALQTLAHEAVGHYGVEAITGPRLWRELEQTITSMRRSGKHAELFAEIDRRYRGASPSLAVRESIAVMVEKGLRNSVVDRAVAAVRRFLRSLGLQVKFTEAELRQHLVRAARYIRGEGARQPAAVGGVFSSNREPLSQFLRGPAIARTDGAKFRVGNAGLRQAVTAHFREAHDGRAFNPQIGEVLLTGVGVKASIGHGLGHAKTAAFELVPNVIRDGRLIDEVNHYRGMRHDRLTVAAPVSVGGVEHLMAVTVRRDNNGARFYLHDVILTPKKEPLQSVLNGAASDGGGTVGHTGVVATLLREAYEGKRDAQFSRADSEQPVHGSGDWLELMDEALEESGEPVASNIDAEKRWNNGERVFALHENAEQPHEVKTLAELRNYAPDQLIALPRSVAAQYGLAEFDGGAAFAQADPIESPAFKRWFRQSKVVTSAGTPKVAYHGTAEGFWTFDKGRLGGSTGHMTAPLGFFFDENKSKAQRYAENASDGVPADERVIDVYLSIQNPKRMTLEQFQAIDDRADAVALREKLKREGFDGIHLAEQGQWVAFEPSQAKSASENRGGFDPDNDDMRFSKPDPAATIDAMDTVLGGTPAPVGERLKAMFRGLKPENLRENTRPAWLGALTLRHLAELGGDIKLRHVAQYADRVQRMTTDRNVMQEAASEVADVWESFQRKDRAGADATANLMHDSTIEGVDPSVDYVSLRTGTTKRGPDEAVTAESIARRKALVEADLQKTRSAEARQRLSNESEALDELLAQERRRRSIYPGLVQRYNELPEAGRKLYVDARDAYTKQSDRMLDALVNRIEALSVDGRTKAAMVGQVRQQFESDRVAGPYFPLQRFGDFWISAEDANGQPAFLMYERVEQWREAQRDLKERGFTVKNAGRKLDEARSLAGASGGFMADLQALLETAGIDGDTRDEVYQLYLRSLPELSVRKHQIHRKATAGYSGDALRAFSANMFHGSFQIARLRHTHELEADLLSMKAAVNDITATDPERAAKAAALYTEVNKRHEWVMNPQDSKLVSGLTSLGFAWYLGTTPAAALVNLTQTAIVSYPVLAARFGAGKAFTALSEGMGRAMRNADGNLTRGLSDEERAAFKVWYESGAIDKSQAHNLAGLSETDTRAFNPVVRRGMQVVSFLFHKAEVVNREATALAAFRLARGAGQSFSEATQYAGEVVTETHFDYSNANRARFMQSNAAKVLLLFRQYSLNMTWFLWRNAYQSLKAETPEVRREARAKLAGVLGMTGIFAGALGMPLTSVMFGVANAAAAAFGGDDEEPWDAEVEFRNFLADLLGPDVGRIIARGPVDYFTGANVSGRVSLNDLWLREPNRELEGKAMANYLLEQAAGPLFGGMLVNTLRGLQQVGEGHTWRGVETMMPKAVKDGMKAIRYSTEGVRSFRGDPIIEDLNVGQSLLQLAGFSPASLNDRYDAINAAKGYEDRIMDRRSSLLNAYAMAWRAGDADTVREVMEKIRSFNEKQPEVAITTSTIRRSMQARMRYSSRAEGGVVLNPNLARRSREQGRFAE